MDCSKPGFPVLQFRFMSIESMMPHNHLILCHSLLLLPSIFQSSGSFPMSQFFTSGGQSIGASPSASVLSRNKSGLISFRMDWLDLLAAQWTLKESSPAPQFEGINSLALRPLYGPTLTSIHDYWKNHTFDYTDLCWQSDVSAF